MKTPTILVLNEPALVRSTGRVFASRGIKVLGASTETEALACAQDTQVDLALINTLGHYDKTNYSRLHDALHST